MSKFPTDFDDDTTLPFINDNITEIGEIVVNAIRDAVFSLEQNIGIGAAGTTNSLAERFGVSILPNGNLKPSAIASLGLVTLPITQDQIAPNAQIPESKLRLDHRTQDLFNYIRDLSGSINFAIGWINTTGIKFEPHIAGALYRHDLAQIDVSANLSAHPFLNNKFRALRNNQQAYNLISDINDELLAHQWADGSPFGIIKPVTTNDGSVFNSNYGHTAGGIFLNTSRFAHVPQTADDLQLFAEFIDSASILLDTIIKNLYSNGISRISRSSSLGTGLDSNGHLIDGYGQNIIPVTSAIAYLLNTGTGSAPFDSINSGDDIIEFKPTLIDGYAFDEKFALVKIGDIIRINYGNVEVPFVIKEKKYISTGSKKYLVRIAGKNLSYAPLATARIDRPLFNGNKFGVLSLSPVNNQFSGMPSLIINNPRGAQTLGIGFSPDEFDEKHYLLYLAIYPTGHPEDGYTILPAIDVTGNQGTTPGFYTLESIVQNTNNAFRKAGFNYRFNAFSYQGEFGICLADSYNNAAFSILSVAVTPIGTIDILNTGLVFPNNVVDLLPTIGTVAPDPLGFGPFGANIASPPFMKLYGSSEAAQAPTKLFVPLRRNNFYVDGTELERLSIEEQNGQILDGYGDGYWVAQIINRDASFGNRVQTTYRVPLDLSAAKLAVGKTIVAQSLGQGGLVDFGRFIISDVTFSPCPVVYTDITVYDSVHGIGFSPTANLGVGVNVALYFDSDSVSFNIESATDTTVYSPFKRHFEIYTNANGDTFTHERGRVNISGSTLTVNDSVPLYGFSGLNKLDIIKISPKLRGYQFGSVNKITLRVFAFDSGAGDYDGYLSSYNGVNHIHTGPVTFARVGEVARFYDETGIDFIDILFDLNVANSNFSDQVIDFQLFPTLSLDSEIMMIGTCQVNDTTKVVSRLRDERQFGNVSEKDLSTSALNFISLPDKLLHFNGVVRGFDIADTTNGTITFNGGVALVDGKLNFVNNDIITVPRVREIYNSTQYPINWLMCVNSIGEVVLIPLLDSDTSLGTPTLSDRVFALFNVVTPSAGNYQVDATTFSDLLNKRKDLTPLYVISSVITGTGTSSVASLTLRDVRRIVSDQDASIDAVVSSFAYQGNFATVAAAVNWIDFNNVYQNTIKVKGSVNYTGTLDKAKINFVGQGVSAQLSLFGTTTVTNVNFSNIFVTAGSQTLTNTLFTDCNLKLGGGTYTGVTFNNCTITLQGATTLSGVTIKNCTINTSFTNSIDTSTIIDSTITVSATKAFTIGSSVRFERVTFNYTGDGTGFGSYDTTNLVNAGSGMIYASVSTTMLKDISIKECIFNSSLTEHVPFISIQLTDYSSVVANVSILNNKFISNSTTDDLRAVISFTSTLTAVPAINAYPKYPKLVNVFIENNLCNQDQIILLSVVRNPAAALTGAMLAAVNTRISNNVCGTIGFITTSDTVSNFANTSVTLIDGGAPVRDKKDQLIISGNSCKLITNLDARGDYIPFRATAFPTNSIDWVQTDTGAYSILNNSVNWIQVGCSAYALPNDGAMITGNRISPANSAYLSNYTDTLTSGVTPSNVGILLRREFNATGSTKSIISQNIIAQKIVENADGYTTTYYYDCAIVCMNSAHVVNNTVIGVVNAATAPIIFLIQTGTVMVSNNILNRAGLDCQAYITGSASGANQVSITNNMFDSQFCDAGTAITGATNATPIQITTGVATTLSTGQTVFVSGVLGNTGANGYFTVTVLTPTTFTLNNSVGTGTYTAATGIVNINEVVGLNIPNAWTFRDNINQAFYTEIPLLETTPSLQSNGFFGLYTGHSATPSTSLFSVDSNNVYFERLGTGDGVTATPSSQYARLTLFDTGSLVSNGFSMTFGLDYKLPTNVKIYSARIGFFMTGSTGTQTLADSGFAGGQTSWNALSLVLTKYNDTRTSNSGFGVLDAKANVGNPTGIATDFSESVKLAGTFSITGATQELALKNNNQIITIDLSAQSFITGKNARIAAEVDFNWKRKNNTEDVDFIFSPVVLRCVYGGI